MKADSGKKDLQVKVYAVDLGNVLALEKTLGQVAHDLGPPEVVVYNAARLRQSKFGDVPAKELTEEFQVCFIFPAHGRCNLGIRAFLTLAYSRSPSLVSIPQRCGRCRTYQLSLQTSEEIPIRHSWSQAVVCTRIQRRNSSLAMMKAAQVNLAGSLAKEYGPKGVHVGTVVVGGYVSPDSDVFSPAKIAEIFWKLYTQEKDQWELIVHLGC